MSTAVGILNTVVTRAFDLFFLPFRALDPIWGLTAVSLVTGVVMLWIFGKMSNQDAVRRVKDRIWGNIMALWLFKDDLALLFRLQGRILRYTMTYMRHALVPMLVLLVPVVLIIVQLNLRFAIEPLEPGATALVKVKLLHTSPLKDPVELEVPPGVVLETSGVRIEPLREVVWRIRAEQPGRHELTVRAGEERVVKDLLVGTGWDSVSPLRTAGFVDLLLYPGEAPLDPSGRIESVEVQYSTLPLSFLGLGVNWLVFFFIASIVFGFAFRRVLGVEI